MSPSDDDHLSTLLACLELSPLRSIFAEEELTFDLLQTMARDDDDVDGDVFLSAMAELGIAQSDAVRLQHALQRPHGASAQAAPQMETNASAVDDLTAAARAAIEIAKQPPQLTSQWTPDGPKMVPAEEGVDNVVAALAAVGAATRANPPRPLASADALLESALSSVAMLDTKQAAGGVAKGRSQVRSATHINHVSSAGGRAQSTVERGTSNKALEAYHRRRVHDPSAGNGHEFVPDGGTIPAPLAAARERERARREEAKYRNLHASFGEHYNDI